jgi:segregation and condensation protein A
LTETAEQYWLKPPYSVLFDLLHLHRVKPWDLNLASLLSELLREMKGRGFIDFSVSGTALLSSAILLRMKSELVLKMEEPPKPPVERPTDYVPPPLAFPLRYEYTTTSLDEVLKGLLDVLKAERLLPTGVQLASRTPEVFEQIDDFMVSIEENMKAFYARLLAGAKGRARLSFLRLVGKGDVLDAVRIFLMLLFLAVEGKVGLAQPHEFGDIQIEVRDNGSTSSG